MSALFFQVLAQYELEEWDASKDEVWTGTGCLELKQKFDAVSVGPNLLREREEEMCIVKAYRYMLSL